MQLSEGLLSLLCKKSTARAKTPKWPRLSHHLVQRGDMPARKDPVDVRIASAS